MSHSVFPIGLRRVFQNTDELQAAVEIQFDEN